jgi:hypothetical protein
MEGRKGKKKKLTETENGERYKDENRNVRRRAKIKI